MITFDTVTVTYPEAPAPVLRDASFTIPEGDLCLVVGRTGSGKSTLLGAINGLVPHFTGGTLAGTVRVDGRATRDARPRDLADLVGYVAQNPSDGFVTDTVEDEIAFGMEQLGLAPDVMRKRVEESLDLLGIADLRRRPLTGLSGGQQQRVAIAAVLAAHPRVLVLDEPTSALDPTAAQDVLGALASLVHDVGMTVVLAEHRLERVMHAADSVLWLRGDGTVTHGRPGEVLAVADVTPPLAALARTLGWDEVPLSVREARRRVEREHLEPRAPAYEPVTQTAPSVTVRELSVRYGAVQALDDVALDLAPGSVTAVMGRNGAGKSTLLWALQGGIAGGGEVRVGGQDPRTLTPAQARRLVGLVPQNAADLLYLPTVAAECAQADTESGAEAGTTAGLLDRLGLALDPEANPHDLSEGQRLGLVLAIQLAAAPSVVLLDEPTRGLDYETKRRLGGIVSELAADGATVVISTHDVEFAAAASHRTVVLADAEVVASGSTRDVCTASPAFSPQIARVFAPLPLLTVGDVAAGLGAA